MLDLFPEVASAHAPWLRAVLAGVVVFTTLTWLILCAVFLAALIRFRVGNAAPRPATPKRIPLLFETVIFGIELVLLVFVSWPFWRTYAEARTIDAAPLEVRVVAQQFVWNLHYPGPDGRFGTGRIDRINEETNPLGLESEDPNAADDIVLRNELHLPVGREVLLRITSKDVVHSFAVPEFYIKRDALPGLETRLAFTPTVTSEEFRANTGAPQERDFEIVCSQLCGQAHYQMRGVVIVDSPEAFNEWLAAQTPALASGDDFWN
jgi:cytochrome c oxidase subunit 2